MSRARLTLLNSALLLCLITSAAQCAFSQAGARLAPAATPPAIPAHVTETVVDSSIPDDAAVNKMLTLYSPKVRALDQIIGKLKGDLTTAGVGSGSMGNFVTDGIRAQASGQLSRPVVLAVTNGGGLRKAVISEGDLTLRDVFELLPFENALVAFDLTGAQVLDLLRIVLSHRDAQSGARIKYREKGTNQFEFEAAKFLVNGEEKDIDPAAVYTIISIDYLLNVTGSDYAVVLKQANNTRPLGITTRDAITAYVKSEAAAGRQIESTLDGRWVLDKAPSSEGPKP